MSNVKPERHREIENEALVVLDAYNLDKPVIDVTKIIKEKGIEIKEVIMPKQYSDVAGFYSNDEKIIYLNIEDKPVRKLFTIAHELGHIFLEHKNYGVLFRVPNKESKYEVNESEANSFASHLLMPDFMIREYLDKYNLQRSDYKKMAEIFGVPVEAMKNKLDYLK